jgi:hypothetical protein
VLDFWQQATDNFYGTPSKPGGLLAAQHALVQTGVWDDGVANPLLLKQGVIVLREELEYFVIPPADGRARTDPDGNANDELLRLKRVAGKGLLGRRQIFTALQRNVNKENNVAEQHLIDMLCMSSVPRLLLLALFYRTPRADSSLRPSPAAIPTAASTARTPGAIATSSPPVAPSRRSRSSCSKRASSTTPTTTMTTTRRRALPPAGDGPE